MGFFSGILESISKSREAYENETEHMDIYKLCQELKRIDSFSINKMTVYQNALANKICEISGFVWCNTDSVFPVVSTAFLS